MKFRNLEITNARKIKFDGNGYKSGQVLYFHDFSVAAMRAGYSLDFSTKTMNLVLYSMPVYYLSIDNEIYL